MWKDLYATFCGNKIIYKIWNWMAHCHVMSWDIISTRWYCTLCDSVALALVRELRAIHNHFIWDAVIGLSILEVPFGESAVVLTNNENMFWRLSEIIRYLIFEGTLNFESAVELHFSMFRIILPTRIGFTFFSS